MTSRLVSAEIGESLVGRNQPAPLALNARPQNIVTHSLPLLPGYCRRIVTMSDRQVGNLPRQVLVDLDAHTH